MMRKTRSSVSIALALAATSILSAQAAQADDFIKGGDEAFTLNLGGIVNQFDSSVRLDGTASTGTQIDLEGNGLDENLTSFFVSGTWRFSERNRIGAMYFGIDRSGSRTSDHTITVGDQEFQPGTLSAETQVDFLLLDYRYSFYKSDAWEFAGALGFYGMNFDVSVSGTGLLGGATVSESTTVPLPLIGLSADWYIQPRWKVSSTLLGMQADIGDVDGSITVFTLSTDYMFTRNFGMGVSYLNSSIDVDVTKSSFNGNIDLGNNAVLLYATMKF